MSQGSETPHTHRQRRSAEANSHHLTARSPSGHRSVNLGPPNNAHLYSRPYVHTRTQNHRNNQVWAPLYQPSSANKADVQQEQQSGRPISGPQQHQERPYNPLPSSYCTGEHAHYRICNGNVCKSALTSYSQYDLVIYR